MARLPPIDTQVHWIRYLLHRGQRGEALARLEKVLATGRAGAETRALAEFLRTAKRGRQPFGAKHLWYEIGLENDELRDAGLSHAERMEQLGQKYLISDEAKIKTAIARYERAMEEIRDDETR